MSELRTKTITRIILGGLVLFFCLVSSLAFAANSKPQVGTIAPSSGISFPNQQVSFTTTYSDADGWQNIQYVYLLFNTSTNGSKCFYGYYDQNTNKLYLRNDTNKSWLGGFTPGSSNVIENSYAKLNCASTVVSGSGVTLTVNWSVTFKSAFLGTKNAYLYVKDDARAYNGWIKKGTWTIQEQAADTIPPTGTIIINNDGLYTNSTSVTLTLSAQDNSGGSGLSQMQFSNDNINWSTPEAYATTKTWTITSGDGTKVVYVKYKDTAENWSSPYSDTIILDTTPPTTTDSGIDGLWHNSPVTITLAATDLGSGVNKTYYSTDGSTLTTTYTGAFILSNEGIYTIKYYSKDNTGNSETVKTANSQVKIDLVAPEGTIKINNDSQYTNSTSATLNLLATDSRSGLAQMRFSNDNLTWSTPEAYATNKTWTIIAGEGQKTVYVKYKDAAGNWSEAFLDTITLDTTPPSISINPVNSPTNQNVVLSYFVTDNFTPSDEVVVSGDNSPYIAEGSHNVILIAQDKAGNSKSESISFTIDKTPPVVMITLPTNGQVFEEAQVQLTGTVDGVAFSETRTLTKGENTLTKTATDTAGNSASASVTVYLYLGELIGPAGGEVFSSDGKVKVVIPQGALSQPQQIKVLTVNKENLQGATPTGTSLLSVVECKPYGLVFAKPVSIIYTLSQAEIPGTPVELGFYDSVQKKILSTGQTSTVPTDGYTVTFSIMHFSTYAALKNLTPQSTPIGAGVKIPLPDMLTGAFSHAIPITVPPGRKGIQPQIALTYRSSNSNSWVGQGFSLNPGYIVRSTRLGPPTYIDTQDTFYFITDAGTTELVHLVDNLYQAKVESSFTKFFKEPDDSWKIVGKDGSILRFGQTNDSKETSSSGTFAWYLTKAVDTNGNYIEYHYTKDQGKSYLSRIDYTGNEMGVSPTNYIEFFLESRSDISSSYISSSKIVTAKRLKEIQVKQNYDLVWRYVLEYNYSPDTSRSLLKTITQYGSDNKSLPTQTLSYQQAK